MRTLAATAFALIATACVESPPEEPLGSAQFIASNALASQDYTPGAPAGKLGGGPAAGTGAIAPPPPAATGPAGRGSDVPPTAASMPVGPAMGGAPAPSRPSPSMTAGTGAAGRAGSSAAGSGSVPIAGSDGAPASTGPATSGTPGTLTVDFTSVSLGGKYAPRNVGAVWIETGSGTFVKTLERWAGIRVNHLSRWNMASGGWGSLFGGGNTADMMDAVSRATLRSNEMHHVMWNMKDGKGMIVPDGMYNVVVEVTDDNRRASMSGSVAFMKGPMPQMVTAPDKTPMRGFSLTYQP